MEATTDAGARSAAPLAPIFVGEFARRFVAAFNALDSDALAAMCTEDVVWNDPTLPQPAHGREEVRAFVKATASAFPDFRLAWRGSPYISPDEPILLIRNRLAGTMRGTWSYSGMEASGQSIDILGVDEFTFRGDLLSGVRSYFDRAEMARQLGFLPPAGSAGDRTMTRLTNLKTRSRRRRT